MNDEKCLCLRCHKPLRSKRSIKLGIGPICIVKKAKEDFLKNQITIFDILGGEGIDKTGANRRIG